MSQHFKVTLSDYKQIISDLAQNILYVLRQYVQYYSKVTVSHAKMKVVFKFDIESHHGFHTQYFLLKDKQLFYLNTLPLFCIL